MATDGLTLYTCIRELQPLVGGRIDKVQQPNKDFIILHMHGSDAGRVKLMLNVHAENGRIQTVSKNFENPEVAPAFCTLEVVEHAKEKLSDERANLTSLASQLQRGVVTRLHRESALHIQMGTSLKKDVSFIVKNEFERLTRNEEGLRQGSRKILDLEKSRFELTETRVKAVDPQTIIARGYTLTLDSNGKFVRRAQQLKEGDILKTKFSDGSVESRVTGVHSN